MDDTGNYRKENDYAAVLSDYITRAIDMRFLDAIPGAESDFDAQRTSIIAFVQKLCTNDAFLKNSLMTYAFLKRETLRYFVDAIFAKKTTIYERILAEDKFSFDGERFRNFFSLALILRDSVYMRMEGAPVIYHGYLCAPEAYRRFWRPKLEALERMFRKELTGVSELFYALILKSAYPYFEGDASVSLSSRLIAIFDRIAKTTAGARAEKIAAAENEYVSVLKTLMVNGEFFGLETPLINELIAYAETISL